MRQLITLLLVLVTLNGYSQTPIDFDNFSVEIATEKLKEAFILYRDTITTYGAYNEHNHYEKFTFLNDKKEMMIPRWSEWVYDNISQPNVSEVINSNSFYHPDRVKWYRSNKETVINEYYKGIYDTDSIENIVSRPEYEENLYYGKFSGSTPIDVKTYEDLAKKIIMCWEGSRDHRCTQRQPLFSRYRYPKYGDETTGLFACCVMFDKENKKIIASLNLITD